MEITVDDEVIELIRSEGRDYRVCTACMGPALVPTSVKPAKESDIKIEVGENALYISRVQAMYIDHVSLDMVYDEEEIDSCPAFYNRPRPAPAYR
ncbi:MAG: hypothetical protein J5674_01565 [Candidatus Methanomethylophilaceae archaeon]|nr:hypothetical protein [Candidatus Methanomethylophilaceae archaeon]